VQAVPFEFEIESLLDPRFVLRYRRCDVSLLKDVPSFCGHFQMIYAGSRWVTLDAVFAGSGFKDLAPAFSGSFDPSIEEKDVDIDQVSTLVL